MKPLAEMPRATRAGLTSLLTDIDDTVSTEGRLTAEAYTAIEALSRAGLRVIPVTGRPAGWCDHIARFWPVAGVVGENGAFAFRYDRRGRRVERLWRQSDFERAQGRAKLAALRDRILAEVPGSGVASDQAYREADLAIDFCEDVAPLPPDAVQKIVSLAQGAGATAKVSSIHVNIWFGDYDKLGMTKVLFRETWGIDLDDPAERAKLAFAGDSPNDAPMFGFFENAVGVANVRDNLDLVRPLPAYVTQGRAGAGFAELAAAILEARK